MSTSIGRHAEEIAAEYLQSLGFKIIDTNWRTRWCEIDIVASQEGVVYFVEVKYRRRSSSGSGFDYITKRKLSQMGLAARFWVAQNDWQGDYELSAIELTGEDYQVTEFIQALT